MGTVVRTSALEALRTGLNTSYLAAYNSPRETIFQQVCTPIMSERKKILVAIADMLPQMREWVGERKFHNAAEHSVELTNPHYELSMHVDADDVDDDEYSGYLLQAGGLGERAATHPDVLLATLMQAAHGIIGFDGQNFFDTDHPIDVKNGIGTQSNLEASGRALTAANFEIVRANMATWKAGPDGELIGAVPTHVMVPRQLEGTARRIFENENLINAAGTATEMNILKGAAKVIVNDRLNNQATTWYALDLRGVIKPFAHVKRKAAKFVMLNRPDDQGMFLENKIQFGVDGRWGVGCGVWFRAYKAVA